MKRIELKKVVALSLFIVVVNCKKNTATLSEGESDSVEVELSMSDTRVLDSHADHLKFMRAVLAGKSLNLQSIQAVYPLLYPMMQATKVYDGIVVANKKDSYIGLVNKDDKSILVFKERGNDDTGRDKGNEWFFDTKVAGTWQNSLAPEARMKEWVDTRTSTLNTQNQLDNLYFVLPSPAVFCSMWLDGTISAFHDRGKNSKRAHCTSTETLCRKTSDCSASLGWFESFTTNYG